MQWQRRMTRVLQWGTCHGKYLDILMGGGTITATVTGRRRYCSDLAQGEHCEFTDHASNKITHHIYNTDFNDANWIKRVIKILASITRPTVIHNDIVTVCSIRVFKLCTGTLFMAMSNVW